jgi:hypothetical protein
MNHHSKTNVTPAPALLLAQIALEHLFVPTLQTRHLDRLDFHEVAVWGIEAALQAAYRAGQQSQTKKQIAKKNDSEIA